ncbi:hypothetical protein X975_21138, partial [Stegodyphus mimosarum]
MGINPLIQVKFLKKKMPQSTNQKLTYTKCNEYMRKLNFHSKKY